MVEFILTLKVDMVSSTEEGEVVQIMSVLELPPREDCRILVSLESR